MSARIHVLLLLCLACLAPLAHADDTQAQKPAPMSGTETFFLAEGLAVFNSGIASADPKTMSTIIGITSPLVLADGGRGTPAERWTAFGSYLAIGALDTTYGDDYSHSRVFRENMLAWNVLYGVAYLITSDEDGASGKLARHVSVLPQPGGGVHLDLHWTF